MTTAHTPELLTVLQEAGIAANSVCTSKSRRVVLNGQVYFLQTEEWCKWLEGQAEGISAAIAKAGGAA